MFEICNWLVFGVAVHMAGVISELMISNELLLHIPLATFFAMTCRVSVASVNSGEVDSLGKMRIYIPAVPKCYLGRSSRLKIGHSKCYCIDQNLIFGFVIGNSFIESFRLKSFRIFFFLAPFFAQLDRY